jgi:catechol 2,3-dioxygenase-like lactoylglutathione lyase family enzyme
MFAATVEKLDEIFVSVRDLPKMRTFYEDLLGFEEEFHDGDWGVGLRTGGAALILVKSERSASGVSLVFACDDIHRSLEAVTDAGLSITHPVEDGHWGAKVAGFEDPEGNTIYLEQPNPEWTHG